jgi:tetratricopeptide (TPR) repeat protein
MAFQGDVGQIGLADVLGSIAANQLAGTLHVSSERGEAWLAFEGGAVKAFSRGVNKAVTAEDVFRNRVPPGAEDVESLIKKKRRTKKSWADFAEAQGAMGADQFRGLLSAELTENSVEIFFWSPAKFDFVPGPPAAALFGEEYGVVLDVNSLIMEAARRRDHWEMIHKVIATPEDVFIRRRPEAPPGLPPSHQAIWDACNGANSVRMVEKVTRATRFATFDGISELVRAGHLRALSGDEMVRLGEEHSRASRNAEAIRLFQRALDTEHANVGVREKLAEAYIRHGEPAKAAGEYKQLAHRAQEKGEPLVAVALYKKAVACAPDDASAREKLVQLLKDTGQRADAASAAMGLAMQARKMLLHDLALAALNIAVELDPGSKPAQELRLETLLALGRKPEAVRQLEAMADRASSDDEKVTILERANKLEPARTDLKQRISDIRSGRLVRRKALFRKLVWSACFCTVIAAVGFAAFWEIKARIEYDVVLKNVHGMLIRGEYVESLNELSKYSRTHKFTLAARSAFDETKSIQEAALRNLKDKWAVAPDAEKQVLWERLEKVKYWPDKPPVPPGPAPQ